MNTIYSVYGMALKQKGQQILYALLLSGFIVASSCTTNGNNGNTSGLRAQVQPISGKVAYIRPGEQLYLLDITSNEEFQSVASFLPSGTDSGEWPKMTFTIEKDKLVVRGGVISNARPVDETGPNRRFYNKLKERLNTDNIDMPTPSLRHGQYIYSSEGLVREILEKPTIVIYGEKSWIVGNKEEYGVPLYMHTEEGQELKSFIPGKGYLVISRKVAQSILRMDIGEQTIFPESPSLHSVQKAVNDYFNIPLTKNTISNPRKVFRVYYASAKGGWVNIEVKKGEKTFFLSPYQMIICVEPEGSTITTDGVEEFPNQVIW